MKRLSCTRLLPRKIINQFSFRYSQHLHLLCVCLWVWGNHRQHYNQTSPPSSYSLPLTLSSIHLVLMIIYIKMVYKFGKDNPSFLLPPLESKKSSSSTLRRSEINQIRRNWKYFTQSRSSFDRVLNWNLISSMTDECQCWSRRIISLHSGQDPLHSQLCVFASQMEILLYSQNVTIKVLWLAPPFSLSLCLSLIFFLLS